MTVYRPRSNIGRPAAAPRLRGVGTALLLPAIAWALTGCATLRVPSGQPDPARFAEAVTRQEGLVLAARPIAGRDAYWELFDHDLPQVGLAAAWVCIRNERDEEISIQPHRWFVQAGGRRYPAMRADAVLDRYYRGSRTRMYSLHAERRAREQLQQTCLAPGPIASGNGRDGFVFFRIDPAPGFSWARDASLVARDIVIGGKRKTAVELRLYAHP